MEGKWLCRHRGRASQKWTLWGLRYVDYRKEVVVAEFSKLQSSYTSPLHFRLVLRPNGLIV